MTSCIITMLLKGINFPSEFSEKKTALGVVLKY